MYHFSLISFNEREISYPNMKNKVERRLIRCKKSKETVLFLLVDSENFSSADDVKKAAKELLRASKKMGKGLGKRAILV